MRIECLFKILEGLKKGFLEGSEGNSLGQLICETKAIVLDFLLKKI